jgi:hypothetical protein
MQKYKPEIKERLLELSKTYRYSTKLNLKPLNTYRKSRNGYMLQAFVADNPDLALTLEELSLAIAWFGCERGDRAYSS